MSFGYYARLAAVAFSLCAAGSATPQDVSYRYDADGRLISKKPVPDGLTVLTFKPSAGVPGTTVAIQGHGFSSSASSNRVAINGSDATVDLAQENLLLARVPASATSGPITVAVNEKSVASAESFLVLPRGIDQTTLAGVSPLPLDDAFRPYGSLANRPWALTFDAPAGAFVSADVKLSSCRAALESGLQYQILNPRGDSVSSGTAAVDKPTMFAPQATIGGTYTLLLSAPSSWNCSIAGRVDPHVAADDAAYHLQTIVPFQQKRLVFDVPEGGALGVATSALTTVPAAGGLSMRFIGPSNELAGLYYCGYAGYGECQGQLVYRPAGTYQAIVGPYDTRTQTINSSFWLTRYLDGGVLESGTVVRPTISKPGQVVKYTFHGRIGDEIRLLETEQALGPGAAGDVLTGKKPSGDCIFDNNYNCEIGGPTTAYDFAPIEYDGTYSLYYMIKSRGTEAPIGSSELIFSAAKRASSPMSGTHVDVKTSVRGQRIFMPFDVGAEEDFSIALTNVISLPAPFYIKATLFRPDGSFFTQFTCGGYGACYTTLQHPASGRYTLVLEPSAGRTETFSATVWKVPFLDGGAFAIDSTKTIDVSMPGQVVRYKLPAAAGQALHFFMSDISLDNGGQSVRISGSNPEGGCFVDDNYYCSYEFGGDAVYEPPALRLSGDYTMLVSVTSNGQTSPTGRASLSVSATRDIWIPEGDSDQIAGVTHSGQHVVGSFEASQGEQFSLSLVDVVSSPEAAMIQGEIRRPDGAFVGRIYCGGYGGCAYTVKSAMKGIYRLDLSAFNSPWATFDVRVLKSHVVDGGVLRPGIPTSIQVERPGNATRLGISVEAGKKYTLAITASTPDSQGTAVEVSGLDANGRCVFNDNYYCNISGVGAIGSIGPFDGTELHDIYLYVLSKSNAAAGGSGTVELTPTN